MGQAVSSSVSRAGRGGTSTVSMRGPAFWIAAMLVGLTPLPLASARPVWVDLLAMLVGLGLTAYAWQRWRLRRPMPPVPAPLVIAGALVLAVAAWAQVQATPGLLPGLAHPAWDYAARALGADDLPAAISLVPERTRATAFAWVTYLGFGLLVALVAYRARNADRLLFLFVAAQGVYAAYGLVVYLGGFETVLWFDKTAYRGSLSSTFINRNSYATFVGLGVLAALALVLRHLRQTLESEPDARRVVLALAEDLWGRVLVPVSVMAVGTVALLLTGSRMGLASFAAGAIVFLGIWIGRMRGRVRWVGGGLVAVVVLMLAGSVSLSGDVTLSRVDHLFIEGDGRFAVFPRIVAAIGDRPWVGHGLGTFESAFRLYRDESVEGFFDRGHSDWLELPMDVGLPAAAAVILAFAVAAAAALRRAVLDPEPERPLLACAAVVLVAVHATMDFSLQIPAVMVAFLLLLVAGLVGRVRTPERATFADPNPL
ncbi:O-antigen ligase family protein [Roseospira marina]|uniref:O-antigen ligase family protein n=1 Tax=Roseospira marina TaxID=140057 RepID=A0A5M6I9G2_9PROT|nr:O-antigen ligase family protein [Roseospira marina]KAA5604308.1 O-antigen ligase family protein [Roseospira marina]MBB4315668.1 hypothetical protein [Roseospira marina]MBB5088726.1 hypothetical protein [Roseospira marina]